MNTLKSNRLSLIKSLSDLQKDRLDRAFRILNQIKKNEEIESGEGGVNNTKEVLQALFNTNISINGLYSDSKVDETKFDDILDGIVLDEPVKEVEKVEIKKSELIPYKIILDLQRSEYLLVDKDDNIIKEFTKEEANELSLVESESGNDKIYCEDYNVDVEIIE